jgi:GNAT superfamily N-acetyltransferase
VNSVQLRVAVEADVDALLMLRADAARWLRAKGLDQWQRDWPSRAGLVERVRRSVLAGETWCVEVDGGVVATMTLAGTAPAGLWTAAELGEPARYAHRLIVARALAGQGIGGELLDWGATQAARGGARWLRVDVWTTNAELHDYYRRQGFDLVRVVCGDYPSGALLQRRTTVIPTPRLRISGPVRPAGECSGLAGGR